MRASLETSLKIQHFRVRRIWTAAAAVDLHEAGRAVVAARDLEGAVGKEAAEGVGLEAMAVGSSCSHRCRIRRHPSAPRKVAKRRCCPESRSIPSIWPHARCPPVAHWAECSTRTESTRPVAGAKSRLEAEAVGVGSEEGRRSSNLGAPKA